MGEIDMTDKQKISEQLVGQVMASALNLTEHEREKFLIHINVISIAAIRGIKGNEFAQRFLQAAIDDENPPQIKPERRH